jgi:hypothetical protein
VIIANVPRRKARGNSTTAVAGSIASAVRVLARAILLGGDHIATIVAMSRKALDSARGNLASAIRLLVRVILLGDEHIRRILRMSQKALETLRGQLGSAIRLLVRAILLGDERIARILAIQLPEARGNLASGKGLGHEIIEKFLEGVPRGVEIRTCTIAADLTTLFYGTARLTSRQPSDQGFALDGRARQPRI